MGKGTGKGRGKGGDEVTDPPNPHRPNTSPPYYPTTPLPHQPTPPHQTTNATSHQDPVASAMGIWILLLIYGAVYTSHYKYVAFDNDAVDTYAYQSQPPNDRPTHTPTHPHTHTRTTDRSDPPTAATHRPTT